MKKVLIVLGIIFSVVLFTPTNVFAMTETPTDNSNDDSSIEVHKVAVITTKVDQDGNVLEGATLQIIDSEGTVVDEWVSDGNPHTSFVPEGEYTLHEASAPEGYEGAEDQSFTVKVEINEIDAGVDFSETPCEHYNGTPLYYVESKGVKSEVYCINQDWETPDEESKYDGNVITPEDIRNYTQQTTYIDAHGNQEKKDVSDQSLTDEELYNKVLDVIYHRQQATEKFSDLSEAEIRYVTEAALKNYTNAGLARTQRVSVKSKPENYEETDYYITDDGRYMWYLYPWYKSFVYDPTSPLGKSIYKTVIGEGDAFGNLARHWDDPRTHNAKNDEEIRKIIARYYELYQFLVSDGDHHPSDMHIYIYSTNNTSSDPSPNNFDDGAYQNLLGITWFNPYDEDYIVELEVKNTLKPEEPKKQPKKKTEIVPPKTGISTTNTDDEGLLILLSLCMVIVPIKKIKVN